MARRACSCRKVTRPRSPQRSRRCCAILTDAPPSVPPRVPMSPRASPGRVRRDAFEALYATVLPNPWPLPAAVNRCDGCDTGAWRSIVTYAWHPPLPASGRGRGLGRFRALLRNRLQTGTIHARACPRPITVTLPCKWSKQHGTSSPSSHPFRATGFRVAVRVALVVLLDRHPLGRFTRTQFALLPRPALPHAMPPPGMYTNPLRFDTTTASTFESCPDPASHPAGSRRAMPFGTCIARPTR